MAELERLLRRQRRLDPLQGLEHLVLEHLGDGAEPIRALRMAGAGVMGEECVMVIEKRGHRGRFR